MLDSTDKITCKLRSCDNQMKCLTKFCETDRFQFYSRPSVVYARVFLLFNPYRYLIFSPISYGVT